MGKLLFICDLKEDKNWKFSSILTGIAGIAVFFTPHDYTPHSAVRHQWACNRVGRMSSLSHRAAGAKEQSLTKSAIV